MRLANLFSLEAGEAAFSLAIRTCRVNDIALSDLLGSSFPYDLAGFRDFPMIVAPLERYGNAHFSSYASLFFAHSAGLYYATTLPEPFRSDALERALRKVDALLRLSVATTWPHVRYCRQCAQIEYRNSHYSWWHRDHQLPLECLCAIHGCQLTHIPLKQLCLNMPHELCEHFDGSDVESVDRKNIGLVAARLESYLASANRRAYLETQLTQAKRWLATESHDSFDQAEIACAFVRSLLVELAARGNRDPLEDTERLLFGIKKLLRDGLDYADPVAASLLILSLNHLPHLRSDFSG